MTDAELDRTFAAYAAPGAPGAALLIVNDTTVRIRTWGVADVTTGAPVTAESHFRLASLSKQFTATAVLLLVRAGKLSLDDHIVDIVPGLPAAARSVTIRQLLGHVSGIWDYEDFVPDTGRQVHDADIPALVARRDSLYFIPGTAFRYSNSAYALLALTVERRSGMPFAQFLHERVFLPAGMPTTVAHVEGVDTVPHRAFGADRVDGIWARVDQSTTSAVLGDGGIYTSVNDLAHWVRTLWERPLPGAELQAAAWTPGVLVNGDTTPYGFGWYTETDRGLRRLSHHGETRGFTNAYVMYPDRRVAVILLTNRIGGAPWALAQQVADRELGLGGTPRPFAF
ncbi:MAG TPA: serine hydrolase domain-containing protein [Gemmatimonadales bacterium]|nr:serine hydrolase domain-containing protein [Gemmatimonadales bacterium]